MAAAISAAFGEPCRGTFFDAFGGSGAVTLHRRAAGEVARAVLSDLDPWLVAMHREVRDVPEQVASGLAGYRSMVWTEADYLRERASLNQFNGDAARFIAINKACFNGLYRKNRTGGFNVGWCKEPHPKGIPTDDHVHGVSGLLSGVHIDRADAVDIVRTAGAGDHVYVDPPYVGTWTGYGQGGIYTIADFRRLVTACRAAASRGARVVLSHADDDETPLELVSSMGMVRSLLAGWDVRSIDATGAISCTADGRGVRREVLASIGPDAPAVPWGGL